MKKILIILSFCAVPIISMAQKDFSCKNRYVSSSTIYGIGSSNILDTYLSPLEYKGTEFRIIGEKRRMTKLFDGKVSTQRLWQANFSVTENKAGTSKELSSMINWNYAWHYNFKITPSLRILAGPMIDLNGGFIYNVRNSNNPAQAKAYSNIAASCMAIYDFNIKNHPFVARYQLNVPLMGMMFSPDYGQSYYEIFSLGKWNSKNLVFTTPLNQPSFRQFVTLDFPLSKVNLRLGYMCDIQQSKVNNLKNHMWSNTFMIGFVKNFFLIKGTDSLKNP